ncbi:glycoside hydrolase family 2 protein [Subtercola boreus]|uniref:glycoside hydrolase family 2 protein n=1 Tax=Subtercola boreus TaxID=120213 RepID=UPI00345F9051
MTRNDWYSLSGEWEFAYDAERSESLAAAVQSVVFDQVITVPFAPETEASGINEKGFHPVVWYRRELTAADVQKAGYPGQGEKVLIHFGAVDYRADVWLNGAYLGHHEGGSTPFTFDITDVLRPGTPTILIVRAEDDPRDVEQPRGKQDWREEPHGIWYHRTTGIWQPVWLEAVPATYITDATWSTDLSESTVSLALELDARPTDPVIVTVELSHDGKVLAQSRFRQDAARGRTILVLPGQENGQEYGSLLWTPETPRLIDARITVETAHSITAASTIDAVDSYLGLRDVGWREGHFLLNDRPYYLRSVLDQGYWPESHLTAPDDDAFRREVQLIKDLGFNAVRVHQKIEDPRFFFWADRLGLLAWAENGSSYQFSTTAIERMTAEWAAAIRRDRSHPSIVTWVPLNESWGVQHISRDPAQLAYARTLYFLTKALDPSRLVVGNDGWELADTDIWAIHDYSTTREELTANFSDRAVVEKMIGGIGPLGRTIDLLRQGAQDKPVMVTEFGGIGFAPGQSTEAWGYETATTSAEFSALLKELFEGIQSSPVLAGYCYTQLTDTLQEANGLLDAHRRPKLPLAEIRSIVLGEHISTASHRRPKGPIEKPMAVPRIVPEPHGEAHTPSHSAPLTA